MPSDSDVVLRNGEQQDADAIAELWRLGWRDGHLGFVPQDRVDGGTIAVPCHRYTNDL